MDSIQNTLPTTVKYCSLNPKPFSIYPSQVDHKRKVVIKSNKLYKAQFFRLDFNNIRFDSKSKKTGLPYSHFIRICGPVYCCCSTFVDLAYCHHILAIIKFELANIILDPLYIRPVEPRKQKKVVQNISMEKHWSLTINFFYIYLYFINIY